MGMVQRHAWRTGAYEDGLSRSGIGSGVQNKDGRVRRLSGPQPLGNKVTLQARQGTTSSIELLARGTRVRRASREAHKRKHHAANATYTPNLDPPPPLSLSRSLVSRLVGFFMESRC